MRIFRALVFANLILRNRHIYLQAWYLLFFCSIISAISALSIAIYVRVAHATIRSSCLFLLVPVAISLFSVVLFHYRLVDLLVYPETFSIWGPSSSFMSYFSIYRSNLLWFVLLLFNLYVTFFLTILSDEK